MRLRLFAAMALLFCLADPCNAQAVYDVANIPAELLKNASAVVRMEEGVFNIKSESNASYSYKTAVTIVSDNAENYATMSEYYDKFSSIYNLKATMYDAKGIKLKTYKSGDFKDQSITSDGTLYDDNRMKKLDFLNSTYPFTVEYSYEVDYNGYLTIPGWYPVGNYDCAVQQSSFTLQMPKELSFRYLKSEGLKTDSAALNNKMVYKWNCQNITAIEAEPLSTGLSTITPWVLCAPDRFEYDNFKGRVDNWTNLGKWVYDLSANVQVLPENIKTTVKNLCANAKTDKEKIAILYKYLQSNTRYVGIQLGIGGFRPMAAERVAALNYGDCKALSNYMKTLLSEAGIASNLVILGSGRPSLNSKFSSFTQANHMILCIPAAKDTTWLECTSQHMPVGFLGNDNAARTVMMVTKDGGQLIQTPSYLPEDNFLKNKTTIKIAANGSADIEINNTYGAAQYQNHMVMMLLEPTEQRKRLMNGLGIPNMVIAKASFVQPDPAVAAMQENISLSASELFSKGADKLFLTLNLLNRRESVPRKVENRKTPFALPYGFVDTDEVTYILPAGFKVDFLPKDILLESEFGSYTAKAVVKDNTIVYTRSQRINARKYGPEKYQGLVDFYKKIYLADKQKAILAMNK